MLLQAHKKLPSLSRRAHRFHMWRSLTIDAPHRGIRAAQCWATNFPREWQRPLGMETGIIRPTVVWDRSPAGSPPIALLHCPHRCALRLCCSVSSGSSRNRAKPPLLATEVAFRHSGYVPDHPVCERRLWYGAIGGGVPCAVCDRRGS